MLDKNMDWGTLRGEDGNWHNFTKIAEICMRVHRDRDLPSHQRFQSEMPPEDMFTPPEKMEGSLGYMDTTQLMKVGEYADDTPQAEWVRRVHRLDFCHTKFHVQPSGMTVKNHRDFNGTLHRLYGKTFGTQQVVKILHFLSDWRMGQVVMMGDDAIVGWKAGEAVTFPWYMEHATANANESHERALLFIAGLRLQK